MNQGHASNFSLAQAFRPGLATQAALQPASSGLPPYGLQPPEARAKAGGQKSAEAGSENFSREFPRRKPTARRGGRLG